MAKTQSKPVSMIPDLARQKARASSSSLNGKRPLPTRDQGKRRTFNETKLKPKRERGVYKKGDSDDENASCHIDNSPDESEGGSS